MTVVTPTDSFRAQEDVRPVYLDCNATSPMDPLVQAEVLRFMAEEYGNAGSRTHGYGQVAKERIIRARQQVADVVTAKPEEVIFTSGATESNNLALLGLAAYGEQMGRRHIVSTTIEHKAVLEPLEVLSKRGFEVTLVPPTSGGWVDPQEIARAMRPDTLLVSVMAANNETGVVQPLEEIGRLLADHEAYFHVDGAQAYGKLIDQLRLARIDLLSISGHKVYAPKGVGALITRRRGYKRVPLEPLMYGGGQERGLRPGTLPVALIAGLGLASEIALKEHENRAELCAVFRGELLSALEPLNVTYNGDLDRTVPHTLNFSVPGVDSEAAIVALKDIVAISNGSACTSQSYEPSHVLTTMGISDEQTAGALRVSWSHLTPRVDWTQLVERLDRLRSTR
ncbi:cysteine desulfurase DndA [Kribbella qitaiheensis]|uniref:cysteine desulfurase n=1 Tax=Kribbella qitaiheensis TaxID=1544730 RepID=A0A7G6WXJ5_9ACTN|nr:cysteine desulfurase DndA [Kribbella qitaiheensis]QNE18710.1 cysteine desulfurase DndA [Kribbella qitaiheensis]